MMFGKTFLILPALLGAVFAQEVAPTSSPTVDLIEDAGDGRFGFAECSGAPIALACDTDPDSLVPMKSTLSKYHGRFRVHVQITYRIFECAILTWSLSHMLIPFILSPRGFWNRSYCIHLVRRKCRSRRLHRSGRRWRCWCDRRRGWQLRCAYVLHHLLL